MAAEDFTESALKHLPDVHRWAFHLCRCPHWAEDITQETYARAFAAADTFDPTRGPIRPWLFSIAFRAYLQQRRRGQREQHARDELAHVHVQPAPAPGPDSIAESDETTKLIQQVVQSLPETQRAVLTLWAMEGLKYREIAQVLDMPLGTVMSRLHRARNCLAQRLNLNPPDADLDRPRHPESGPDTATRVQGSASLRG